MESLDDYIVGECLQMCPKEEVTMLDRREKERLLHVLEVLPGTEKYRVPKPDINRMVKSFCRSAVGKSMQEPKNLRAPIVLLKTVNYLLNDVICRNDVRWTVIYDFVMDRLRAVRQDMVIQNISTAYYISLLQPIVRFHAYASYRLCEENINNFDPFINKTHLQECLKRLLCMYDHSDDLSKYGPDLDTDFFIKNRPQFEAMYVILNLGNSTAILRALNLSRKWRTDLVENALTLSLCYANNNFIKVCKLIRELPLLLLVMASLHLPQLRRNALKIMSVAYSSKNLTFPVNVLRELLLYDTDTQLITECKYYGLEVRDNGVCFLNNSFAESKSTVPPTRQKSIDHKLTGVDVSTLILFPPV